jgi:broad specificity phosphatase PhoE
MGPRAAHHLSGLVSGLAVLPLEPERPALAALGVGFCVVVACTLLFDPIGRGVLFRKLALYTRGAAMMLVGRDKKWSKKGRPDPATVASAKDKTSTRIIFVRHGESAWNLIFNVGPKILVPFKAIHALLRETLLLLRLDDDSVLYDSPLNEEGLAQARELNDLIENYRGEHLGDVQAMRDPSKSVVCSSNLRRAAQTILLGLKNRLDSSDEKIQCLTSLQEISTNVDTLSITPPHKAPRHLGTGVPQRLAHADRWDPSLNSGNKRLRGRGLERLQAFAEWASQQDKPVVVGGHSLFFRGFFREFLPVGSNPFNARDTKIANGGVVALTLERGTVQGPDGSSVVQYRVAPESVAEVHLGFASKKKKDKKV